MSKLSFKSFCIEFYVRHIGSTGADVYRMFSESGLLKTLGLYGQSALSIAADVIQEHEGQ